MEHPVCSHPVPNKPQNRFLGVRIASNHTLSGLQVVARTAATADFFLKKFSIKAKRVLDGKTSRKKTFSGTIPVKADHRCI